MLLTSALSFIYNHPLNRHGRLAALGRFARWQLASRIIAAPIALPFVDNTRLLVSQGMQGATGNWYCGLHEQDEMGFVLHFIRSSDLFFDIGANIGSYTILAAGACGAKAVSFEPVPATYESLVRNIRLNSLSASVIANNWAVGSSIGELQFTSSLDCMNRALMPGEQQPDSIAVKVATLDGAACERIPTICKIDVEGFETQVIAGGTNVLSSLELRCVLIEINGSGLHFGISDSEVHSAICQYGFVPVAYDVLTRRVEPIVGGEWNRAGGNTIYVRDLEETRNRVKAARKFKLVNGAV